MAHASALTGTDPDSLMEVDPLSAHVFVAFQPDQPISDLLGRQLFLCSIAGAIPPSRPAFLRT
jgi:hypothetical protein